jgi:hypothetical protein
VIYKLIHQRLIAIRFIVLWKSGATEGLSQSSSLAVLTLVPMKIMAENRAEYNILTSSILTRAMSVSLVMHAMLIDVVYVGKAAAQDSGLSE